MSLKIIGEGDSKLAQSDLFANFSRNQFKINIKKYPTIIPHLPMQKKKVLSRIPLSVRGLQFSRFFG
jgi:hypothetical protein